MHRLLSGKYTRRRLMVCIPSHSSSSAIVCINHVCMLFPGRSVHLKRVPPTRPPAREPSSPTQSSAAQQSPFNPKLLKNLRFLYLKWVILHCMKLLVLSAAANRFSKLKEQAEEYASLIME
ncbi:hypothetical protein L1887_30347 [Cichorium endivia]|nr:hypothetical protein L1887_30347 [Cichorium endivia]